MKLTLKNFMKHDVLEVEFQKGINWIDGPNGSGKSCIIDALRFVLGFEPRNYGRHQEKLIKLGSKSCKVTLEAEGYSVARSKSKSSHSIKITNESKMFQSDSLEDIQKVAEEIFGLRYEVLRLCMKPIPFSSLEDRQAVLRELTLKLPVSTMSEVLGKETKLDSASSLYCATRIKEIGFEGLIREVSNERVNLNRSIVEIDKKISAETAVIDEKQKTSDSINADLVYQERELESIDKELTVLGKLKTREDEYKSKLKASVEARDLAAAQLKELVDSVEKHWIPDDLPVIKCRVVRDPMEGMSPILTVGKDSVVNGTIVDVAVLPDSSKWDEGPLSTARNELIQKIADLEQESKRIAAEYEGGDQNTKEQSNAGVTTGAVVYSSQRFDSLGARRSVLLGVIEALKRQLAYKFTGSKATSGGENAPAPSGQALPGPSETPLNTRDANSQTAPIKAGTLPAVNEIEAAKQRVEEFRRNRAAKSALYDKYDLLIQGLGAKGTVQKTLAGRTISVLNESLAKSSQVFFEGVPALPLIKIDDEGNVECDGVLGELRSVGECLIDSAQIVCAISLNMRLKPDVCPYVFILDDINDLDKSKKESLLAWLTLLRGEFSHIILATCGSARPQAPDGLIKFIGLG